MQVKIAVLLFAVLIAGCDQATFSHFEVNAIHKACTENGGVVVESNVSDDGVHTIKCRALQKWSPKD